jgi:hypothetical protein
LCLGVTESAIAEAIFSAPTLKFIFKRKEVGGFDLMDDPNVARAFTLSACLDRFAKAPFAADEAYIPTE